MLTYAAMALRSNKKGVGGQVRSCRRRIELHSLQNTYTALLDKVPR